MDPWMHSRTVSEKGVSIGVGDFIKAIQTPIINGLSIRNVSRHHRNISILIRVLKAFLRQQQSSVSQRCHNGSVPRTATYAGETLYMAKKRCILLSRCTGALQHRPDHCLTVLTPLQLDPDFRKRQVLRHDSHLVVYCGRAPCGACCSRSLRGAAQSDCSIRN